MSTSKQRAWIMVPPTAVVILIILFRCYQIWIDEPPVKWMQLTYLFCLGSIVTSITYFIFIENNAHLNGD